MRERERTRERPIAVGRGVLLRPARPEDRREFVALLRASRAHLRPWEPRVRDPDGSGRFARFLGARASPDARRWLVCRRSDGAIVGGVSLNHVVRGVFQNAAIGYWLGAAHTGRGHMTEAVRLAVGHAFRRMGLHRVEANVIPENRASKGVVRRAGFRKEGLSPRFLKIDGRWRDHERWAVLAEEWRSGRRKGG
jgi:ribosomal-protein-alanine N-acetyltransferase